MKSCWATRALTTALFAVLCGSAQAQVDPTTGHYYQVILDTEASWTTARDTALSMGGYLVTITSAEEQQLVEDLLVSEAAPTGGYWLGLKLSGGVFVWDNGELLDYTNWNPGEPNGGASEPRGQIIWTATPSEPFFPRRGEWNDIFEAGTDGNLADLNRAGFVVESSGLPFQRGDCNVDGIIDISDPVLLLDVLFLAGDAAPCDDACDGNDDGTLSIVDALGLLAYLFAGGFPPDEPFGVCGEDPSADGIVCVSFAACP